MDAVHDASGSLGEPSGPPAVRAASRDRPRDEFMAIAWLVLQSLALIAIAVILLFVVFPALLGAAGST